MPHKFPRDAFLTLGQGRNVHDLARLYATLVVMELALKDDLVVRTGQWKAGHDVPTMMTHYDASLAVALGNALSQLHCTDRSGNDSGVSVNNYPHIRYLRHNSEFPPPLLASSDAQIAAVLAVALQCLGIIRTQGLLT